MARLTATTFLAHFGVRGMKWGVIRRPKGGDGVPDGQVQTKTAAGKKVTAEGGRKFEPHSDAVKVATSKQVAKNSTTDALSTKDLQDLVTRMNLERQYSQLTTQQKTSGQKFVSDLLMNVGKQQAQRYVNDQTAALIKKHAPSH